MIKRIAAIAWEELRATFRGLLGFYRGYVGYIVPESSGWVSWLALLAVSIVACFYLYWVPTYTAPMREAWWIGLAGAAGALLLAAIVYVRTTVPARFAIANVFASLTVIVTLVILLGHPIFPGWLKLVSALVVMVGAIMVARRQIREKQASSVEKRPRARGAILALLPFYLLSVVCLIWGINDTFERDDNMPWYVVLFEGRKDGGPAAFPIPDDEAIDYRGEWWKAEQGRRSENGRPQLPDRDRDEIAARAVVNDTQYTDAITPTSWWCYGIKKVFGIAIEDPVELVYYYATYPIGRDLLGFDMEDRREFGVQRLSVFHPVTDILEAILGILTGAFFIGIIAELATTVQRRFETGQADLDLTQDHGVALLASANGVSSVGDAKQIERSWLMLDRIRARAVETLTERLASADDRTRLAAADALRRIRAAESVPQLEEALAAEERDRVRASMLTALAVLQPTSILSPIQTALLEGHPIRSRTALTLLKDLITRVMQGNEEDDAFDGEDPLPRRMRDLAIDSLAAPDDQVRKGVIDQVVRLPRLIVVPILVDRLESGDASLAWQRGALRALGRFDDTDAERMLIEQSRRDETTVRVAALIGLASGTTADSLDRLREAVAAEDPRERRAALDGLAVRGSADDLDRAIGLLQDLEEMVQIAAARAIGQISERVLAEGLPIPQTVIQPLATIARNDFDSLLRDEACFALARIGDPEVRDLLESNLPDPQAALALGLLGDPAAVDSLWQAALDTSAEPPGSLERLAPIQSLGMLGSAATVRLQELYRMRANDSRAVEDLRQIANSLSRTVQAADPDSPDEQASGALTFLLHEFDRRNRETARFLAPAIARTRQRAATDTLIDARYSPVAAIAIRALAETKDPDVVPYLIERLDAYDPEVRDAVFDTLATFSADIDLADDADHSMREAIQVMGRHAVSVLRVVGRFTGGLLSGGAGDDDDDSHRPSGPTRPDGQSLLGEFG